MNPTRFKMIRERLGLSQDEMADILGLAGKKSVSNIETGVRNQSKLGIAIMEILNEMSPPKAKALMELLRLHIAKIEKKMDE